MKKINDLIIERNLTVKELAIRMGVSEAALIEWTKDDVCPPIPAIVKLAESLGVSHQDLLYDDEDYPRFSVGTEPVINNTEVAKATLHSLAISYYKGILAYPFSETYMYQKAEDIYDAIRISLAITDIFTRLNIKLHSDECLWQSLLSLKPDLQDEDSNYGIWGIDLFYTKGLIQINELNLIINRMNEFIRSKTNNPIYTSLGAVITMTSVFNAGLRLVEMESPTEANAVITCYVLAFMILSPIGITTSRPVDFKEDSTLEKNAPLSYITNLEF